MTVCQFFLQGRCRYGEKCWNEHPRGGRGGGGGFNSNSRAPQQQQQQSRGGGGGGFGNRVWVNPSQQRGGYVQPSSFGSRENDQWSRRGDGGGSDWSGDRGGGGFGRRENVKSSEFSFSQNRFSALDTPSTFNKGGRVPTADDDNDRKCEIIQNDMEIWESSRQWVFSTYSSSKNPLSGFTDLSPEELRFEYYTSRASGNLQSYINGINQLLSQWRNRVQELKIMNATTRAALLRELNDSATQGSSAGFGSIDTGSTFGFASKGFGTSDQLNSFSFAAPASGFSSVSAPPSTGFGSAPAAPPPSGFGASPAPPASSFSFAASDKTSAAAPSAFGSASGFSFSDGGGGGFGTGFGAQTTVSFGTTSGFGQPSTSVVSPAPSANAPSDCLFSTETSLTAEELNQFKAKRFTLGQIPLKPPPANLLVL